MILTAKVKLVTDEQQVATLKQTLEMTNAACDYLSQQAWEHKTFARFKLQKAAYHECRAAFPALSAQVVVRAIAKVADAYKLDKKVKRTFKPHGAISYDSRILSWNIAKQQVSIWTVGGRLKLAFAAGARQLELLSGERGEADLCYVGGVLYLFVSCKVPDARLIDVKDVLGIDLGIVQLATDSDGESYSGTKVEENRHTFAHRRRNLQRKGTKAAKRKLKKLSGRQSRFQGDVNHVISKAIVKKAVCTDRSIALEELTGIRGRVKARKPQRGRLHNWAFADLRTKIEYKAKQVGIPVVFVDPRHTSQACNVCGNIDKRNRPNQATFKCIACGHVADADTNAALNIRARAVVKQPMVANCDSPSHGLVTSSGF